MLKFVKLYMNKPHKHLRKCPLNAENQLEMFDHKTQPNVWWNPSSVISTNTCYHRGLKIWVRLASRAWTLSSHWDQLLCRGKYSLVKCMAICLIIKAGYKLGHGATRWQSQTQQHIYNKMADKDSTCLRSSVKFPTSSLTKYWETRKSVDNMKSRP